LWSCTTCGACVEQCPVDIEHVDHIVDMRRYQNLIASAFPSELGGLFKNIESKGKPWGMGAKARMDWAKDLPFTIKVLGADVEMGRHQHLIAAALPSELGGLFKSGESKGKPWGMGAKARMDWAKGLPFTIKVLGEYVVSADDLEYLFWVGCAGAYEDRAKKTT